MLLMITMMVIGLGQVFFASSELPHFWIHLISHQRKKDAHFFTFLFCVITYPPLLHMSTLQLYELSELTGHRYPISRQSLLTLSRCNFRVISDCGMKNTRSVSLRAGKDFPLHFSSWGKNRLRFRHNFPAVCYFRRLHFFLLTPQYCRLSFHLHHWQLLREIGYVNNSIRFDPL